MLAAAAASVALVDTTLRVEAPPPQTSCGSGGDALACNSPSRAQGPFGFRVGSRICRGKGCTVWLLASAGERFGIELASHSTVLKQPA